MANCYVGRKEREEREEKSGVMKKRFGIILMVAGVIILVCSFLLIYRNYESERMANYAVDSIQPSIEKEISNRKNQPGDAGAPDGKIKFDGNEYIGYLKIPALGLKLPVMESWSYDKLQISPCRYSGSLEENNLVIAAHNYQRHFGNILTLKEGEKVVFVDHLGYSYEYKVVDVTELEATAVDEMINSEADLTLFTCTYGGVARVTVRCNRFFN